MSLELPIIFLITAVVRIFSVTIGGGGMVLIPMLLAFGLPPSEAVATNRFGGFSSVVSIIPFHQKRQVRWKLGLQLLPATIAGSLIGGFIVLAINQQVFQILLGVIILLTVPILFIKGSIGLHENHEPLTRARLIVSHFLIFLSTIFGGIFASTGLWMTYVGLYMKMTFLESAATRKITSLVIGMTTLILFIAHDIVRWPEAVTMFIASAVGSWIGVLVGVKAGNLWIKRLFAAAVIISTVKFLLFP